MSAQTTATYVEKVKERLTAYFDFETVPELLKDKAWCLRVLPKPTKSIS